MAEGNKDVMAEGNELAHEKESTKCASALSRSNAPEENEIQIEKKVKKPMSEFDEKFLKFEDHKISMKYKYPGALGGKWMLFFLHEYLDKMWEEAVRLYSAGVLTGIKWMITSTAVRYSRASDDNNGVISFACGPCNHEKHILKCGLKLISEMKYFNACGFVSYKTDVQSKRGTKTTGATRNYLYRLPVATHDHLKVRSALSVEYPIEVPSCTWDRSWLHESEHSIVVEELTEPIEINSTARWTVRFQLGTPHDSAWVIACRAYRNKMLPGVVTMWSSSRLQSFLSMKTLSRVLHIPCACMSAAPVFNPKKILILTKLSRYDFERRLHPKLTEEELKSSLYARGSDYYMLLHYHNVHKSVEQAVVQAFDEAGIETKVVNRLQYCDALISWADAVVTTGGDGTYLLAASRIYTRNKPVIGFNSDPTRSKGQLCLPEKYSANPRYAVNQLLKGMFRWQYRTRIRVTLRGKDIYRSPIELHDQQLLNPEYRYLDIDSNLKADQLRHTVSEWDRSDPSLPTRTLPVLALNEVFIGECISARVSYLEMQFDDQAPVKHKCSGLIVCTGTGSTSWTFNVNKLTEQNLEQALLILEEVTGNPKSFSHPSLVAKVADKFNNLLVTDAEDNRLVYTIRDQLVTPIPRHVPHQHFGMADARTSPLPVHHQLGRLVSESACEQEDPGSNPAADTVDAARNTAWDLGKQPNNYRSNYPTQEWARSSDRVRPSGLLYT
ncbi:NAD kinase [Trinorchestia longiramus]|nr:NAD kinase [Trinorchestia longiramus]